jgi:hypothetical protein
MPISQEDTDLIEWFLASARASMAPGEWDAEPTAGGALTQEQAVTFLLSLGPCPRRTSVPPQAANSP